MSKKNVHEIYFKSFVGIWKRAQIRKNASGADQFLAFIPDCTYTRNPFDKGTVNGEVDEVSIEEDEVDITRGPINGKIILKSPHEQRECKFTLQHNPRSKATGKYPILNELLIRTEKSKAPIRFAFYPEDRVQETKIGKFQMSN